MSAVHSADRDLMTYGDATDLQVLTAYERACDLEAELYGRGESVPEIITTTAEAWMREGISRGIL